MRLSEVIMATKREGKVPVVAEVKAETPRDGDLLQGRDPVVLAREMEAAGATALSVVTEPEHFGGSIQIFRDVSEKVRLPILRKDFITTKEQVYESKDSGASAILLIFSMMSSRRIKGLDGLSKRLGMETVIEVHNAHEMNAALGLSPGIIGINNRDISRLEMDAGDVSRTEKLAPLASERVILISESSIKTRQDVKRAIAAGADAVLVGTALMKTPDIKRKLEELSVPWQSE